MSKFRSILLLVRVVRCKQLLTQLSSKIRYRPRKFNTFEFFYSTVNVQKFSGSHEKKIFKISESLSVHCVFPTKLSSSGLDCITTLASSWWRRRGTRANSLAREINIDLELSVCLIGSKENRGGGGNNLSRSLYYWNGIRLEPKHRNGKLLCGGKIYALALTA